MKSVFSLIFGLLVLVALYLPWWDMNVYLTSSWGGETAVVSEVSGWEALGETDLWWIGNTGPILALVGGVLVIGCALTALVISKWFSNAENAIALLRILPRIAGFLVIVGVVWYMIDARNADVSGGGGMLPFDGTGFGPWLAIAGGLGGLFMGVTVPSVSQMWRREFGERVVKGSPVAPGVRGYSYHEDRIASPKGGYGSAKEHFNRASDYQSTGKEFQAIVEYDTAIKLDPNYTLAYFNRGSILLQQGKKLDALADFKMVVELSDDPDLIQMAQHRIDELSKAIGGEGATSEKQNAHIESDEKSADADPRDLAKNHFDRACDYETRGDDDLAVKAYTQAIENDPNYALAYFNRGSLRLLKGNTPEAITDFEKVTKLSIDDNLTRMAQKRLDEATTTLNQEISAPEVEVQSDEVAAGDEDADLGSTAKYHFNRARDYEARGDDELAIAAYGQAIVSEPDNALAYFNRGSLYLLHERRAEAIVDFEKAVELSDDDNLIEMAQNRISELSEQEFD